LAQVHCCILWNRRGPGDSDDSPWNCSLIPLQDSRKRRKLATLLPGDSRLLPQLQTPEPERLSTAVSQPVIRSLTTENIVLRGRVLVVDDNEDHRRMLTLFLNRAGATVISAESGQEAYAIVERAMQEGPPIDLVVTDIMMPEMNGTAFAEAVRGRGWQIPLIACSAAVMSDQQAACLSAGCNAFVAKPIRRSTLLGVCARWINAFSPELEPG
jgi:CheY-like chemotaxis protein